MNPARNFPAKYSQLNEMNFTPEAREVLIRVISVAFPHKNFPPGPYERMADRIITAAGESTWFRMKLIQGVETLNSEAGGQFTELPQADAMRILKRLADTDFFAYIRRSTILEMYEDEEVWEALGYEGPSYDKGGYLNRGFNDLDWLPEPRIDEYDKPHEWEDIPGNPGQSQKTSTSQGVDENQTASTSAANGSNNNPAGDNSGDSPASGTSDSSPAGTSTTTAEQTGKG